MPNPLFPPGSTKQPTGLLWDEVFKEPRNAYRFVDADGQGWEAPARDKPFVKSDWNKPKDEETSWFDATARRWKTGARPSTYRDALPHERPEKLRNVAKHGYASPAEVPVLVKMRYRPKPDSKRSKNRSPEVRALDRIARKMFGALDSTESSPHLATAVVGGQVEVAGNTGTRHVTAKEMKAADERLATALAPDTWQPVGRGTKDATKLRALMTGDYQAHHGGSVGLGQIAEALRHPTRWLNVEASGGAAEHGELTVIGNLLEEMRTHRGNPQQLVTVNVGGVKLACLACWWVLNIVNDRMAGPLGYQIRVSGTHKLLFPGWRTPDYIRDDARAKADLAGLLPPGWHFDREGVLYGDATDEPGVNQEPEESDSEWEEVT